MTLCFSLALASFAYLATGLLALSIQGRSFPSFHHCKHARAESQSRCYFHLRSPRLAHADTISTTENDQMSGPSDETTKENNAQLLLRFSPLINGPSFLPLHVEVMLVVNSTNANDSFVGSNQDDFFLVRNPQKAATSTPSTESVTFHRFDFIPANPTDPSTVVRLLLLQSVPGKIRYRTVAPRSMKNMDIFNLSAGKKSSNNDSLISKREEEDIFSPKPQNDEISSRGGNFSNGSNVVEGRGVTLTVPLSSFSSGETGPKETFNEIVQSAIEFTNEYRDTCGKELRLVGGKNCFSFALDLLSHLRDAHSVRIDFPLLGIL